MPETREYPWKNIGDRIREARTKLGLTQVQLARQVGVSSQTVWSWEAGRGEAEARAPRGTGLPLRGEHGLALGPDVLEADLLREAHVSFHDAIAGLPLEDIESIHNFVRFVRQERRRRTEGGG